MARKAASPATDGSRGTPSASALGCRRKFLHYFPAGFQDEKYIDWERGYKWKAHEAWEEALGDAEYGALLEAEDYQEIAARAIRIESKTNLLFSFEKMALRDAVRAEGGARLFALGLRDLLLGEGDPSSRFDRWCEVLASLPRRQTRVLTWPLATVFGFIAQPRRHIFLKPNVTRRAAAAYGYEFHYQSQPNSLTYAEFLAFAATIAVDLQDLRPRDMIDLQSFMWVMGSEEYE